VLLIGFCCEDILALLENGSSLDLNRCLEWNKNNALFFIFGPEKTNPNLLSLEVFFPNTTSGFSWSP
jgi:hypothetical protein